MTETELNELLHELRRIAMALEEANELTEKALELSDLSTRIGLTHLKMAQTRESQESAMMEAIIAANGPDFDFPDDDNGLGGLN